MNALLLVVTGVSLLVAGFMSAIAWRMSREERRRSDARVAELSSAIYDEAIEETPMTSRLFAQPSATSRGRFGVAALVGGCVVAIVAGLALVTARSSPRRDVAPAAVARTPAADVPLELLALEHERDGEQLVVRGIVRKPADAADRLGLTAVVLLFGRDGAFVSSGRAAMPAAKLAAGATAPFVVTVPGAADVDRFRLSFRTDARIEPHVDRRTRADVDKDLAP